MYFVKVKTDFSSAHTLRGYPGKCENMHGHNWHLEVVVKSEKLGSTGMIVDFKELKNAVKEVTSDLDHHYLNDLDYFKEKNPTSEHIAKYVSDNLMKNRPDIAVHSITVWETSTSCATYTVGGDL